jgi:hypothetical protein
MLAFCVPVVAAMWWKGHRVFALVSIGLGLWTFYPDLIGQARYVFNWQGGPATGWPVAGGNVAEQQAPGLVALARHSAGSAPLALLALAGLTLLSIRQFQHFTHLGFLLVVGAMSLGAVRFAVFLAPLAGLGVGYLLYELYKRSEWRGICVVAILVAWALASGWSRDNHLSPIRQPFHMQAMDFIKESTPEDSVVWTDWGHGHLIKYATSRGTVGDGTFHPGRLLYILNRPLAEWNPQMAANWIRFFTHYGTGGFDLAQAELGKDHQGTSDALNWLFSVGPDGARPVLEHFDLLTTRPLGWWLRFLYPPPDRPTYVLVDFQKLKTAWFAYGTWDFDLGTGKAFTYWPFIAEGGELKIHLSDQLGRTLGHRLFTSQDPISHFRLTGSAYPLWQLWEVQADGLPGG